MVALLQRDQPRPTTVLLRWINLFIEPKRNQHDLHRVFANGSTLPHLLKRCLRDATKHPATRFVRTPTRATALANLKEALAVVWEHSPRVLNMPSAEQVLDGAPRGLLLRFIDELYTIFVVRSACARLAESVLWMDKLLRRYSRSLRGGGGGGVPPAALAAELRSGTLLACVLHAHLPPDKCAGLVEAFWQPRTRDERHTTLSAVWHILEEEHLAPCGAEHMACSVAVSGRGGGAGGPLEADEPAASALEVDMLIVVTAALHARFGAHIPRYAQGPLPFRDGWRAVATGADAERFAAVGDEGGGLQLSAGVGSSIAEPTRGGGSEPPTARAGGLPSIFRAQHPISAPARSILGEVDAFLQNGPTASKLGVLLRAARAEGAALAKSEARGLSDALDYLAAPRLVALEPTVGGIQIQCRVTLKQYAEGLAVRLDPVAASAAGGEPLVLLPLSGVATLNCSNERVSFLAQAGAAIGSATSPPASADVIDVIRICFQSEWRAAQYHGCLRQVLDAGAGHSEGQLRECEI